MNDSVAFNPKLTLLGQRTNSLCVADKFVTQPPELSAYQGHKSSTEAEISCESTTWGRAAWALRHPPTLPESAVSVATRTEGGGGWCSVKVKRQPFESADGWLDGRMDDGWWRCRERNVWWKDVAGSVGSWSWFLSISASDRLMVRGRQLQQLRDFFHSQWQRRSRSWLRGLNQPLTTSLWETPFSHTVLF